MSASSQRICIIGAGPSGIALMNAFAKEKDKGEEIPQINCFEQQSSWGGLWNLNWRTGLDANGRPLHESMYPHLWSNGPKESLEFPDYSFEQHFGQSIPSYPPRVVLRNYLGGFMHSTEQNIQDWIQYDTRVEYVHFDKASNVFSVRRWHGGEFTEEEFDYVVCCTGHFSHPNVPEFPGFETFPGRILHSHDFRHADEFRYRTVLIIGSSYSAEDIASQCYKFGAKKILCSYRNKRMTFKWPENVQIVPLLTQVIGSTCHFKDGSVKENIDVIILCTGYQHSFPFMQNELRLQTANRLWVNSLHDGIVWPTNPRLLYIGMQDQWFSFTLFQAQAYYARDVILQRIVVPDQTTMDTQFNTWRMEEETLESTDEANIRFQAKYVNYLMQKAMNFPKFDVEDAIQCFLEWEDFKHHDIIKFRDHSHRSFITRTKAPVHHTPWLQEFDDSLENFVPPVQDAK